MAAQLDEHWRAVEPDLLALAVEIARKLVHHDISEHDDFVLRTVSAGLAELKSKSNVSLMVNPADYDLVVEQKETLQRQLEGSTPLDIFCHASVDRGGCLIETENGFLDAKIDSQLAEIERALMAKEQDGKYSAVS